MLLGDRYELLAAAQTALVARIPIAHIHGGEATEGAIDEAIRHAITKMSHLHFVAAEAFRRRVVQLGEAPERIWVVGATGLDNVERLPLLTREQLSAHLGIELTRPTFLITYHPVTLLNEDPGQAMAMLLNVMDETGGTLVLTGVNADTGASYYARALENNSCRWTTKMCTAKGVQCEALQPGNGLFSSQSGFAGFEGCCRIEGEPGSFRGDFRFITQQERAWSSPIWVEGKLQGSTP